jgi:hypothetical protein
LRGLIICQEVSFLNRAFLAVVKELVGFGSEEHPRLLGGGQSFEKLLACRGCLNDVKIVVKIKQHFCASCSFVVEGKLSGPLKGCQRDY